MNDDGGVKRWHRWLPWVVVGSIAVVAVGGFLVMRSADASWGDEGERIASPTGEFEVVTYEWSAMIDPGWNLAIERVGGDDDEREWFWRSAEMPVPKEIRFTGPTSIEVVDDLGRTYPVEFDPETLEPDERYCANLAYCTSAPWDGYTRSKPGG